MNLSLKHYGSTNGSPSKIIEMTVDYYGNKIVADITDLKGRVDEALIIRLRDIADDLEQQNELLSPTKRYNGN